MDAGEGMACPEEHQIFIPDNAGRSGESVGIESDEEDSSGPSKPDVDEKWIREVEDKIWHAFPNLTHWRLNDETEPKICKFTLSEEISRPRLMPVEFSKPRVVTIGPFHRQDTISISDNERISDKEKWVIMCFTNWLYNLDWVHCLFKMKNQVAIARKHYCNLDTPESFDSEYERSFAEMLLLDSYFILFMLTIKICKRPTGYTLMPITSDSTQQLKLFPDDAFKVLDIIFNKEEIALDLLIFDNQIPFFVIEELFKELKLNKTLHEYALEFFETIHPKSAQHCKEQNSPPKFLHLLDLFHWSRVPKNEHKQTSMLPQQLDSINKSGHIPNAVQLRESATEFDKKTFGSSLDITFQRCRFRRIIGVLNIPELLILDYSSHIFYNLIIFEMQSLSRGCYTMAFSALMQDLLQSEEDVKLLRRRGILVSSSMADNQVVSLFKCLRRLTENHQMPRFAVSISDWSTSLESVGLSRSQFRTNWMQNWTRRTQLSKTGVLPVSGAQNIFRVAQKRVLNLTETGSQFGSHVPGAQMWVRKFDIVNIACFDAWQGGSSSATTSSVLARARRRKILRGFVAGLEVFPAVLLEIRNPLAARIFTRGGCIIGFAPKCTLVDVYSSILYIML
uniref:Uncharacterized protein n=1 Tax=Ananas comosus var. bracteatus TaxID=296719 RepID=A0A6V7P0J3_ANACO|nr:unnamed protein product [Ananas comosus var. bracteatus]